MSKSVSYMVAVFFLLLFFTNANAQDSIPVAEAPPVEMVDTSVYETSISNHQFKEPGVAEKVDVRTIPEQDVSKVKSDEDYWYANLTPPREKKEAETDKKTTGVLNEAWFNTLFWIVLIGGFLALLIWFLATGNVSLFRKRAKTGGDENAEDVVTENIFEINFEKEIQKAIGSSDFRLAVRLMYLRTLKDLSMHNLINYTHEKTNADYLFQLAGSSYYKTFFRLTRSFDYSWYGHFPLSPESFSLIQNDFNNFKQQLT